MIIAAVSQVATLYAIACTAGGSHVTYRLYLRDSGEIGGVEALVFALHDPRFGWSGTDLLVNPAFEPRPGRCRPPTLAAPTAIAAIARPGSGRTMRSGCSASRARKPARTRHGRHGGRRFTPDAATSYFFIIATKRWRAKSGERRRGSVIASKVSRWSRTAAFTAA